MKTIYAIPGLGTTHELFMNISVPGHTVKVLEWPLPEKGLSLKDYARRFLPQINQQEPVTLMGVSFGGMLCTELSEMLPVNKVFLISSSKNSSEFPFILKTLKLFPVYRLVPNSMMRSIARTKRRFIGFEKSFEPVFISMIARMPENYFSCCVDYIIHWERKINNTNLVQIHGTADKMLTHKTVKNYYPIPKGSHGMILSNANQINEILNKELNG